MVIALRKGRRGWTRMNRSKPRMDGNVWITDYELRTADYGLRITDYRGSVGRVGSGAGLLDYEMTELFSDSRP
jgi:hypothetical protein